MSYQRWSNVETALHNVEKQLYQRRETLFQRCFNVAHQRSIKLVQHWKSDVGFCLVFVLLLFQRWSTTLKQRWSGVKISAGWKGKEMLCEID